jgi:hypothetical protein
VVRTLTLLFIQLSAKELEFYLPMTGGFRTTLAGESQSRAPAVMSDRDICARKSTIVMTLHSDVAVLPAEL